jgi:hypothetical protein
MFQASFEGFLAETQEETGQAGERLYAWQRHVRCRHCVRLSCRLRPRFRSVFGVSNSDPFLTWKTPHESDQSMFTRRKPVLPTFRDVEEQIYLRFVRVPLILSQQLSCDEALLLSYLLNHRKMVGMSSPDAVKGRFWVMKSQLQRDLKLSPKEQRMTLDRLRQQRFLRFDDEFYRNRWTIHLLRRRLLTLAQESRYS